MSIIDTHYMETNRQTAIDFSDEILHKIKNAFERGDKLTVLDATRDFNTVDLRKYVSILRAHPHNMPITDQWDKHKPTGKRFKRYWIEYNWYIEYLSKENAHKVTRKNFIDMESATEWAINNLQTFHPDLIRQIQK